MSEKIYLVALHYLWINQKKLNSIFSKNKNYKSLFENISFEICSKLGFSDEQIRYILKRKSIININLLEEKLKQRNVRVVTILDDEYPEALKHIPNSPYLLYIRWFIDNSPKISIVWARKMTSYWEDIINQIVWNLSKYFVIVSGWASGCDTQSHKVALNNWNKTICVIWTWIDIDYPTWNKKLYDKIVSSGGWIISIFPIGEVWNAYNFPIRNEIVAWLSIGVVIIEAKVKSGTLITANLALDIWKDLYAIPWDIFKLNSVWCNNLIKNGNAKLVTSANDILEEYNINNEKKTQNKIKFADKIEENIYNHLILEPMTIDELNKIIMLDISTLSFKLSAMEISGFTKKWFWWKYYLN
jgi:DNA processing protein